MAKKAKRASGMSDPCRQTPAEVVFWWVCPDCAWREQWSYLDLATRGAPVCPKCDGDMGLEMT